ncbi:MULTISPECIES: hypothetical protein [unclassified Lysobacter]|uniref:hypothetical protein n=1 Tax=unclassified Lysobacter TaxID=2635362 RepID=UPI0006FF9897|nr:MULTISPECIES: hypothetical protein [unclassified Lysobacter]KRC33946.1 hypothetical protein ASE10_13500 [Lysobacter sp. Root76]KRD69280.1 hypothetical protein ASE45_08940 [Lysobacter sp. Root96]
MKVDFDRAALHADAIDLHLDAADRFDLEADHAEQAERAMQLRTYALYRRVQAGECRMLEKLALRGDAC